MTAYLILLRLIHLFAGVFWTGSAFFLVGILAPTVQAAGPEGGRFMQRLVRANRLGPAFAGAALMTTLSGVLLFERVSGTFSPAFFRTGSGWALTIGGLAGILAFLHGGAVQGRGTNRMVALVRQIEAAGQPSAEQAQELQALSARLSRGATWSAVLLAIALVGMSIAQYLR